MDVLIHCSSGLNHSTCSSSEMLRASSISFHSSVIVQSYSTSDEMFSNSKLEQIGVIMQSKILHNFVFMKCNGSCGEF